MAYRRGQNEGYGRSPFFWGIIILGVILIFFKSIIKYVLPVLLIAGMGILVVYVVFGKKKSDDANELPDSIRIGTDHQSTPAVRLAALSKYDFDNSNRGEFGQFCSAFLELHGYTNIKEIRFLQYPLLIANKDNKKYAILCKWYYKEIGAKSIKDISIARKYLRTDYAMVITSALDYTQDAKDEARSLQVMCWSRSDIQRLLPQKQKPLRISAPSASVTVNNPQLPHEQKPLASSTPSDSVTVNNPQLEWLSSRLDNVVFMTNDEFVHYCTVFLNVLGYHNITNKTWVPDQGYIIIAANKDERCAVLCRQNPKAAGVQTIRTAYEYRMKYSANHAIVLTSALDFTWQAEQEAYASRVNCCSRGYIRRCINSMKNGKSVTFDS